MRLKRIRIFRNIVFFTLTAIVLAGGALVIALRTEAVRKHICRRIESLDSAGRLRVGDALYMPLATLQLSDVSYSSPDGSLDVEAKEMRVSVSLVALAFGEKTISDIYADSLRVRLADWPDAGGADASTDTFALPAFSVNQLKLTRASFFCRSDTLNGLNARISNIVVCDTAQSLTVKRISGYWNGDLVSLAGDVSRRNDTIDLAGLTASWRDSRAKMRRAKVVLSNDAPGGVSLAEADVETANASAQILGALQTRLPLGLTDVAEVSGELLYTPDTLRFNGFRVLFSPGLSVSADGLVTNWWPDKTLTYGQYANIMRADLAADAYWADGAAIGMDGPLKFELKATDTDIAQRVTLNAKCAHGDCRVDFALTPRDDGTASVTDGILRGKLTAQGQSVCPDLTFGGMLADAENSLLQFSGRLIDLELLRYKYAPAKTHGLLTATEQNVYVDLPDPNGRVKFVLSRNTKGLSPSLELTAVADSLNTYATNITPSLERGVLSVKARTEVTGSGVADLAGWLKVENCSFAGMPQNIYLPKLILEVETDTAGARFVTVESEQIRGKAHYAGRIDDFNHIFSPSCLANLNVDFNNLTPFLQFADTTIEMDGAGKLRLEKAAGQSDASLAVCLPKLKFRSFESDSLSVTASGTADSMRVLLESGNLRQNLLGPLNPVRLEADVRNLKHVEAELASFGGVLRGTLDIEPEMTQVDIEETSLMLADKLWTVDKCRLGFWDKAFAVEGFRIMSGDHYVSVEGRGSSANPDETLEVKLSKISIEDFLHTGPEDKYSLAGNLTVGAYVRNPYNTLQLDCDARIDSFVVDRDNLENFTIRTVWDSDRERMDIECGIITGGKERARARGEADVANNHFDLMFHIDSLSAGFLNFYLDEAIDNMRGTTNGWLRVHGPFDNLQLHSKLDINKITCGVKQTSVEYEFLGGDTIYLYPDNMVMGNLRFKDRFGNIGIFGGNISHNMFSGLNLNIFFDCNHQQVLNTTHKDNNLFYGNVFATGRLNVTGTTSLVHLGIDATSEAGSEFEVQLKEKGTLTENNGVVFKNSGERTPETLSQEIQAGCLEADINVRINDNATIKAVIDPQTRNELECKGKGLINVKVLRNSDITMSGEYTVSEGEYYFSFKEVGIRKFSLLNGSSVTWSRDPLEPNVNLTAVHSVNAPLQDLVGQADAGLRKSVPVNCVLHLTDNIANPTTRFNVELVNTQNNNQDLIRQYITTDAGMQTQFVSLLVRRRFARSENAQGERQGAFSQNDLAMTLSDLVTGKMSEWFSQNRYNIDVGLNYQPGDETTNEEYAISMQTELGGRVVLKGNLGYGRNVSESANGEGNNLIGDFDVELKLNKSGSLMARAYTHSNNDIIYTTSPTTQGIGVSYRTEFDNFGVLVRRYAERLRKLLGRKRSDMEDAR